MWNDQLRDFDGLAQNCGNSTVSPQSFNKPSICKANSYVYIINKVFRIEYGETKLHWACYCCGYNKCVCHSTDVIIGAMASQITSLTICRCSSKKTSKRRVTSLCAGNSPVTDEFPAQMASNAENVSIWWRHHVVSYDTWYIHLSWGLQYDTCTAFYKQVLNKCL